MCHQGLKNFQQMQHLLHKKILLKMRKAKYGQISKRSSQATSIVDQETHLSGTLSDDDDEVA